MKRILKRRPDNRLGQQRGMTIIGLLLAVIAVGFVALIIMKVVPMYLNDQKIDTVFQKLEETSGNERAIRSTISKSMDVNMVYHVKPDEFKMEKVGNGIRVTLDYEARANVFGNLYIVAEFKHQTNVRR
ncbi:MAG: DUF4845 domain-containing protein [Halothiobacillaceae bacterium]